MPSLPEPYSAEKNSSNSRDRIDLSRLFLAKRSIILRKPNVCHAAQRFSALTKALLLLPSKNSIMFVHWQTRFRSDGHEYEFCAAMNQSPLLTEALRLYRAGQSDHSRRILHDLLKSDPHLMHALLWLARVSSDDREAIAAAELALSLQPDNEIAQRAVAALRCRNLDPSASESKLEVMRLTGMTLSQARAVTWPFRGLNRPLGVLADEGKLTLKDLAYAVEAAREQPLKQAARTLLLNAPWGIGSKRPRHRSPSWKALTIPPTASGAHWRLVP